MKAVDCRCTKTIRPHKLYTTQICNKKNINVGQRKVQSATIGFIVKRGAGLVVVGHHCSWHLMDSDVSCLAFEACCR